MDTDKKKILKANDIPFEIIEAAQKVRTWMEINGFKNWQLGGICDRRMVIEMEEILGAIEKHSCNYKIGHPMAASPCPICLIAEKIRLNICPSVVDKSSNAAH
jgi:hypothetical protein